jgi:hypothetical protein
MILAALDLVLFVFLMGVAGWIGRGARKLHRTRK